MLAQKLYRRVAEQIAAAIADGRFAPGSRLPSERELTEEFAVSRPTIREAVIALEMRGLVEARKGSGAYVTRTPPACDASQVELDAGAFELMEARALFEGEAAALAATAIGPKTLRGLRRLLAVMENDPCAQETMDADRRFHLLVAEATGNTLIRSAIETLWVVRERSPLCVRIFTRARREGVTPCAEEHRLIFDALEARDPQAAREAMRSHLRRVTADLLDATRLALMKQAETDFHTQRRRVLARTAFQRPPIDTAGRSALA